VLLGRDADHEVEVGDSLPLSAQSAPLFPEQLASFLVDGDEGNAPQEIVQAVIACLRIAGIVHSLPQFGKRNR